MTIHHNYVPVGNTTPIVKSSKPIVEQQTFHPKANEESQSSRLMREVLQAQSELEAPPATSNEQPILSIQTDAQVSPEVVPLIRETFLEPEIKEPRFKKEKCITCGAHLEVHQRKYCIKCIPVKEVKKNYCKECGIEVLPRKKRCTKCNNNFAQYKQRTRTKICRTCGNEFEVKGRGRVERCDVCKGKVPLEIPIVQAPNTSYSEVLREDKPEVEAKVWHLKETQDSKILDILICLRIIDEHQLNALRRILK